MGWYKVVGFSVFSILCRKRGQGQCYLVIKNKGKLSLCVSLHTNCFQTLFSFDTSQTEAKDTVQKNKRTKNRGAGYCGFTFQNDGWPVNCVAWSGVFSEKTFSTVFGFFVIVTKLLPLLQLLFPKFPDPVSADKSRGNMMEPGVGHQGKFFNMANSIDINRRIILETFSLEVCAGSQMKDGVYFPAKMLPYFFILSQSGLTHITSNPLQMRGIVLFRMAAQANDLIPPGQKLVNERSSDYATCPCYQYCHNNSPWLAAALFQRS